MQQLSRCITFLLFYLSYFEHRHDVRYVTTTFKKDLRTLRLFKMSIGHALKQGIFVVGAKRTPFGAFGGSLKGFTPTELQVF